MQYQVLPSFIFGFLLTTFPRWMGLPALTRKHYLPVGIGLFGGQLARCSARSGCHWGVLAGALLTTGGDRRALGARRRCCCGRKAAPGMRWSGVRRTQVRTCSGCWCISCSCSGPRRCLPSPASRSAPSAAVSGVLHGAHRMFPFFAGTSSPATRRGGRCGCSRRSGRCPRRTSRSSSSWLPLAVDARRMAVRAQRDDAVAMVAARAQARNPRGRCSSAWHGCRSPSRCTPRKAWLPQTPACSGLDARPAHALFIGFFGSVLIAMVTRVTQGHSGRPLVMPAVAWFAFIAIQLWRCCASSPNSCRTRWRGWRLPPSAGWWRSRRGWRASAASIWRRARMASRDDSVWLPGVCWRSTRRSNGCTWPRSARSGMLFPVARPAGAGRAGRDGRWRHRCDT